MCDRLAVLAQSSTEASVTRRQRRQLLLVPCEHAPADVWVLASVGQASVPVSAQSGDAIDRADMLVVR